MLGTGWDIFWRGVKIFLIFHWVIKLFCLFMRYGIKVFEYIPNTKIVYMLSAKFFLFLDKFVQNANYLNKANSCLNICGYLLFP